LTEWTRFQLLEGFYGYMRRQGRGGIGGESTVLDLEMLIFGGEVMEGLLWFFEYHTLFNTVSSSAPHLCRRMLGSNPGLLRV
jgi:hypothetical protein